MIWYLLSSILMAFAGIFIYIYYFRKGQFEDTEMIKFQMFHEEDD